MDFKMGYNQKISECPRDSVTENKYATTNRIQIAVPRTLVANTSTSTPPVASKSTSMQSAADTLMTMTPTGQAVEDDPLMDGKERMWLTRYEDLHFNQKVEERYRSLQEYLQQESSAFYKFSTRKCR